MVRSPRNGLNLIEVLIVVGIIGIGIALLLPATRRINGAADRMKCANNLKQLILALHSYESAGSPAKVPSSSDADAHADHFFPPGCLGAGAVPEERLSWMVALLPYLERESLHQRFDTEKGYAGNLPAAQTRVGALLCPSAKDVSADDALTHYVALSGIGLDAAERPAGAAGIGFMGYDRRTSVKMVTDGTSNTLALIETRSGVGPWARGGPSTLRGYDPAGPSLQGDDPPFGGHPAGMNAAMVDGSVHFLRRSIDPKMMAAVITIAGGEPLDPDWESR